MPSQALLLKQYFSGASACNICDKVDAISSLGHAPVFRALNAPCDGEMISHDLPGAKPLSFWRFRNRKGIVAEGDERLEDGAEVCASGGGEQPGDVLENGESGIFSTGSTPHFPDDSDCLKKKAAAFAFVKSGLFAGDGLILTGRTKRYNIDRRDLIPANVNDAAQVLHLREPAGGHRDGIRFDLRSPDGRHAVEHALPAQSSRSLKRGNQALS